MKRRVWRGGWRLHQGGDQGNITLLSLGMSVVAMMLVLVVSAATAVHVQHTRLMHLADELALDAADALDVPRYYAGEAALPTENAGVEVTQSRMETTVADGLLRSQQRTNLDGVRVVEVSSSDGNTATVTIAVVVYPLFGMEALLPYADGITLTATGSARGY